MDSIRPGLAVKYPNSGDWTQPVNDPWTDWRITYGHATQLDASRAGGERRIGLIVEEVNVPRLLGELLPAQIGDDICVCWRPDTINAPTVIPFFRFFPTVVTEVGIAKDDPNWFRCSATTAFWYDFIPS